MWQRIPSSCSLCCVLAMLGCAEGAPQSPADGVQDAVIGAALEVGVEDRASADARPPAYRVELDALTERLHAAERGAEAYPNDWLRLEHVAALHVDRARLTGRLEEYLAAEEALRRAFEIAPSGSGPLLTRAHLNFTLHRLAAIEPDLSQLENRILIQDTLSAQILGLRGDVALHSGRFEDAERLHRDAEERDETPASAFRVAYDRWQTGQLEEADRWLVVAASRLLPSDRRGRAWMSLQRGLLDLDRGRYLDALVHYLEAERLFSGWWLVREHVAEIFALTGDLPAAERTYRAAVSETNSPELMDALASVLQEQGRGAEAATLRSQARAEFDRQLEQLPEAAYGHALDHYLQFGRPDEALRLAEANHALRPGGEATVKLAQALLRSGRAADARVHLEGLLAGPYRTAELHATAARVYVALGDDAAAAEQERLARAIHPEAPEQLDWLGA